MAEDNSESVPVQIEVSADSNLHKDLSRARTRPQQPLISRRAALQYGSGVVGLGLLGKFLGSFRSDGESRVDTEVSLSQEQKDLKDMEKLLGEYFDTEGINAYFWDYFRQTLINTNYRVAIHNNPFITYVRTKSEFTVGATSKSGTPNATPIDQIEFALSFIDNPFHQNKPNIKINLDVDQLTGQYRRVLIGTAIDSTGKIVKDTTIQTRAAAPMTDQELIDGTKGLFRSGPQSWNQTLIGTAREHWTANIKNSGLLASYDAYNNGDVSLVLNFN